MRKKTIVVSTIALLLALAPPLPVSGCWDGSCRDAPMFECRRVAGEIKCDAHFVWPHEPTWESWSSVGTTGQLIMQKERGFVVYFAETEHCQTIAMQPGKDRRFRKVNHVNPPGGKGRRVVSEPGACNG